MRVCLLLSNSFESKNIRANAINVSDYIPFSPFFVIYVFCGDTIKSFATGKGLQTATRN